MPGLNLGLGLGLSRRYSGGGAAVPVIGGVAIGTVGSSGYTNGMKMVAADDFDGPLSLYSGEQTGRYPPTRQYGAYSDGALISARASGGLGGTNVDPYWTGQYDANRGVPVASFSDSITQASSIIKLKQRTATAGERLLSPDPTAKAVSSMIHLLRRAVVRPPCVMEWYERRNANTHSHMTGWAVPSNVALGTSGSMGSGLEVDFEASSAANGAGDGTLLELNNVIWPANTPTVGASFTPGTGWNKFAFVIDATGNVMYYANDTLLRTYSGSQALALQWATYLLLTNHTYRAGWADADTAVTMEIDWWRYWTPQANDIIEATTETLTYNVAFGGAVSIALPTLSTAFGGIALDGTEMLENVATEVNQPIRAAKTTKLPDGLSYDAPSATISGTVTSASGRITLVRYISKAGCYCRPQTIIINVGPRVLASVLDFPSGSAVSYNLDALCDVGTLTTTNGVRSKVVAVTGLTGSGLSYSDATGLLTGTMASGTFTASVTVTNSLGQASSATSVTIIGTTVAAALVQSFTGTPGAVLSTLTPTTGGTWTPITGNSPVSEPAVDAAGTALYVTATNNYLRNTAVMSSPDYYMEATLDLRTLLAGDSIGVIVRASAAANTYYAARAVYNNGLLSVDVFKVVNGTSNGISSAVYVAPLTPLSTLRLTARGSTPTTLIASIDGRTLSTGTDSSITAAGSAGMRLGFVQGSATGRHISAVKAQVLA